MDRQRREIDSSITQLADWTAKDADPAVHAQAIAALRQAVEAEFPTLLAEKEDLFAAKLSTEQLARAAAFQAKVVKTTLSGKLDPLVRARAAVDARYVRLIDQAVRDELCKTLQCDAAAAATPPAALKSD